MKKKLAFGIAGASAALIAGWRLVQKSSESPVMDTETVPEPVPPPNRPSGPGTASQTSESRKGVGTAASGEPPAAESKAESDPAGAGSDQAAGSPTPPDGASKAELYEIAQERKIKGRSKMSKAELREAIDSVS